MRNKNIIPTCFLTMLLAFGVCFVISLAGCGGSGGGSDGGDDDDPSYPGYSELGVSFGGVVLDHFADQTVTLKNVGTINLPLGQIEAPESPFTIEQDDCSGNTLTPSETCDIQVRFEPTSSGSHYDGFVVPITDSSTNFVGVNLDGIGHSLNVSINQVNIERCPTIQLIVSVTDGSDDFVTGLTGSNFTLTEGDDVVDSGEVVSDMSNLSVVLALDSSGSVSGVLGEIKTAAKAFVGDLDSGDEVAVFKFSDTAEQIVGFTEVPAGTTDLEDAIDGMGSASGDTALYDALTAVSDYFDTAPAANERRAVVIVTDGEDTVSTLDLEDAIADAQTAGIPIFTIGLGTTNAEVLQTLAEDTGGQYYDAPDETVLDTVYPQIAELLTNQYKIEYTSNSSGGTMVTVTLAVEDNGATGEDTRSFDGCSD